MCTPTPIHLHLALHYVYERSEILECETGPVFPDKNIAGDRSTTVHPNAVDENEIVDWSLRKFFKLEIE